MIITALLAIAAIAADMRAAGARFPQQHRSNYSLLAPLPTARRSVHMSATQGIHSRTTTTARVRTQEQALRRNDASPTRSNKAPKARTQPSPHPNPAGPTPPEAQGTEAPGPPPQALSACQRRLASDVAIVRPLPSITGPDSCGAEDVVRLEAVVLEDGQRVALMPAATLRCPIAEALAHWVREKVAPAAASTLGSPARTILTAGSYDCRDRDRIPGAQRSEHSRANALDLRGITLANGAAVDLTDKAASKEFRELVRQSACNTFTTVLGPGSDSSHADNVHLDLIERKGGYRICQWDVLTVPEVGSSLPPENPRASNGPNNAAPNRSRD